MTNTPVRVLVVDDNKDAAESLATLFDLLGYDTRTEYDGRSGLATARAFRPAACVLDINMPEMDGCELATALRDEFDGHVRLVAVTGATGTTMEERIDRAGFDARFAKPADPALLLRAVATAENHE